MTRAEYIQSCIDDRKEYGETRECVFYITVLGCEGRISDSEMFKTIDNMLKRNNVDWILTDTVNGSWCLNTDYIKTNTMDCIIEYSGVFPVNWNIDDVVLLEKLYHEGKISIYVEINKNGKWMPNY